MFVDEMNRFDPDALFDAICNSTGKEGKLQAQKLAKYDSGNLPKDRLGSYFFAYILTSYVSDDFYRNLGTKEDKNGFDNKLINYGLGRGLKDLKEKPSSRSGIIEKTSRGIITDIAEIAFDGDIEIVVLSILKFSKLRGYSPTIFCNTSSERTSNREELDLVIKEGKKQLSKTIIDLKRYCKEKYPDKHQNLTQPEIGESSENEDSDSSNKIPENPYKGLEHFSYSDSALFFGRNIESQDIANRVKKHPFTALIGASGSGKSSLAFAGVAPETCENNTWIYFSFRPSLSQNNDPFASLARKIVSHIVLKSDDSIDTPEEQEKITKNLKERSVSLTTYLDTISSKNEDKNILIIIDQFEELFTLNKNNDDLIVNFINFLAESIDQISQKGSQLSASLLLTMRVDFLEQASQYQTLEKLIKDNHLYITSLDKNQLSEAIIAPSKNLGVYFEDGLVEAIINDAMTSKGSLPLVEFTLSELWATQANNQLKLAEYYKMERIYGSLSQKAEKFYKTLDQTEKKITEYLFIKLVNFGEENPYDTRQKVLLTELSKEEVNLVNTLAGKDNRLLVINHQNLEDKGDNISVEIVHEELLRKWERLKNWLDDNRDNQRWKKQLQTLMLIWEKDSHKNNGLLSGNTLSKAIEKRDTNSLRFNEKEIDYINISQRHNKNKKYVLTLIASFLVIILSAFSIFSYTSWKKSEQQIVIAENAHKRALINNKRFLAQKSKELYDNGKTRLSALLSLEILKASSFKRLSDYEKNALSILEKSNLKYIEIKRLSLDSETDLHATSSDLKYLITSSHEGKIFITDLATNKKKIIVDNGEKLNSLRLSKNNEKIVATSSDFLKIWDIKSGDIVFSHKQLSAIFFDAIISGDENYIFAMINRGNHKNYLISFDIKNKKMKKLKEIKIAKESLDEHFKEYRNTFSSFFSIDGYPYKFDNLINLKNPSQIINLIKHNENKYISNIKNLNFNLGRDKRSFYLVNFYGDIVFEDNISISDENFEKPGYISSRSRLINNNDDFTVLGDDKTYKIYRKIRSPNSSFSTFSHYDSSITIPSISKNNTMAAIIDINHTYKDVVKKEESYEIFLSEDDVLTSMRIFDIKSKKIIFKVLSDNHYRPSSGSFSPNNKYFFSASIGEKGTRFQLWNLESKKIEKEFFHNEIFYFVGFSNDSKKIISAKTSNKEFNDGKKLIVDTSIDLDISYQDISELDTEPYFPKKNNFNFYNAIKKSNYSNFIDEIIHKSHPYKSINTFTISRHGYFSNYRNEGAEDEFIDIFKIYDEKNYEKLSTTKINLSLFENINKMDFTYDGVYLVFSTNQKIYFIDKNTGKIFREYILESDNGDFDLSSDGKMIMIAQRGIIEIFDIFSNVLILRKDIGDLRNTPRFTFNSKNITWSNNNEIVVLPMEKTDPIDTYKYFDGLGIPELTEEERKEFFLN